MFVISTFSLLDRLILVIIFSKFSGKLSLLPREWNSVAVGTHQNKSLDFSQKFASNFELNILYNISSLPRKISTPIGVSKTIPVIDGYIIRD